jgi:hypothetical protein
MMARRQKDAESHRLGRAIIRQRRSIAVQESLQERAEGDEETTQAAPHAQPRAVRRISVARQTQAAAAAQVRNNRRAVMQSQRRNPV